MKRSRPAFEDQDEKIPQEFRSPEKPNGGTMVTFLCSTDTVQVLKYGSKTEKVPRRVYFGYLRDGVGWCPMVASFQGPDVEAIEDLDLKKVYTIRGLKWTRASNLLFVSKEGPFLTTTPVDQEYPWDGWDMLPCTAAPEFGKKWEGVPAWVISSKQMGHSGWSVTLGLEDLREETIFLPFAPESELIEGSSIMIYGVEMKGLFFVWFSLTRT